MTARFGEMKKNEIDIAEDIYSYLRGWWGLKAPVLTDTKCDILARSVSEWRATFQRGKYGKLRRMYQNDKDLAGYLVAFGPRYAYTLYFLLKASGRKQDLCEKGGVLRVCYIGGGAAIDLVGLLALLYERGKPPRDLEVHFVDRSPQWRRFHNSLFGAILPKHFPRTRTLPHYHDLDLNGPAPNYSPTISGAFESSIFILSNVLSEFSEKEQDGVKEHLRFLLRSARASFYLAVADSNAKKLRPRLSWLEDFVAGLGFPYYLQFSGQVGVDCDWLKKDDVTARVFGVGGPSFLTSVNRRGFVAKVLAGKRGRKLRPTRNDH